MEEKDYQKINSVKVIIENNEGKILLIQESADDPWMPLHWGLPGGRPNLKEPLYTALKRKLKEEIGIEVEPLGLYRVEEVLHDDRTVLMFIATAKILHEQEIKGKVNAYKWVTAGDIAKMDTSEFTAFYAKKLILDYLSGNREYISFDIVETQQYYDLDQDPEFQKWLESGRKT
jgi:8-oxo-dGTP diphosphatase